MASYISIEGFAYRFREVSEQKYIAFSADVDPLIDSFPKIVGQLSVAPLPKAVEVVRSILDSAQVFLSKLQLQPVQKKKLVLFASQIMTCTPGKGREVSKGLESSIVAVCQVGVSIIEVPHRGREEDFAELFSLLRSLAYNLELITPRSAALFQLIDAYKRCFTVFIRNLAFCDEATFESILSSLENTTENLSRLGGVASRLLSHWAEVLSGPDVRCDSYKCLKRLLTAINRLASGVAGGVPQEIDKASSLHKIMDSIDTILAFFVQRGMPLDLRNFCNAYRSHSLGYFCKIYPTMVFELCERDRPIDFFPTDTLETLREKRLLRGDYAKDPLFNFYTLILVDLVHNGGKSPITIAINSLFTSIRMAWKSKSPSDCPTPFAWSVVAGLIRSRPSISSLEFNNLCLFLQSEILGVQACSGFVEKEASDAFLDVLEAFDDRLRQCVFDDARLTRALIRSYPNKLVLDICQRLRPSAAFDWFERVLTKREIGAPFGFSQACEVLYSGLVEMSLRGVPPTYARDQFSRAIEYTLKHLPEMTEEEFLKAREVYFDCREKWRSDLDIATGLLRVWKGELAALLHKVSCATQLGGPSVKARSQQSLLVIVRETVDFLMAEVLGLSSITPDIIEIVRSIIELLDELVPLSSKLVGTPQQRTRLFASWENFFWLTSKVVPAALVARLEAIEPGKAPIELVRKFEKLMFASGTLSSIVEQEMRLLFLELARVEIERFCLGEGMRFMPHSTMSGCTLCPPDVGDEHKKNQHPLTMGKRALRPHEKDIPPMYQHIEENMVLDKLDAGCLVDCAEYRTDPEQRMGVLFALRFYVDRFVEKQRGVCIKAFRLLDGMPRVLPESVWEKGFSCMGSSFGLCELNLADPRAFYRHPLAQQYMEFCQNPFLPSRSEETLLGIRDYFEKLFVQARERAQDIQGRLFNLWPHYERGVEILGRHVQQMPGYFLQAPLNRSVPIENGFSLLAWEKFPIEGVNERFFQGWIEGMRSGGEVGLAKAIAASFSPGGAKFENSFLRELELLDEVSVEEPPVASVEAERPLCVVVDVPKKPSPQIRGRRPTPRRGKHRPVAPSPQPSPSPVPEEEVPMADEQVVQGVPSKFDATEEQIVAGLQKLSLSDNLGPDQMVVETPQPSLPQEIEFLSVPQEDGIQAITVRHIEACLLRPVGEVHSRVHRWWKSAFFKAPSLEEYYRHTYPFQLVNLIEEYGEREPWASVSFDRLNNRFLSIGQMYIQKHQLRIFGVFSECFSSDDSKALYHHDVLNRSEETLFRTFSRFGTFFGLDKWATPKGKSLFQQKLFERFRQTGSFFAPLDSIPSVECCDGRYAVRIGDMTVQVDDRKLGIAYILALKVRVASPQ